MKLTRYDDHRYVDSQYDPRFATVWALHVCDVTADEVEKFTTGLSQYTPRAFTGEYAVVNDEDWSRPAEPGHSQQIMLIVRTGSWRAVKGAKNRSAAETHVKRIAFQTIGREPVLDWSTAGDWSAQVREPVA